MFFDGQRCDLGDYVVMPNHVHVLLVPYAGEELGGIVKSWKRFTAKKINARLHRAGRLWQAERFDHLLRSRRQLKRVREYIRENPERAGLGEGEFAYRGVEWRFEGEGV